MQASSDGRPSVSFRVEKEAKGFRLTLYVHPPGKPEMACAHIDGLTEEEAGKKKQIWEQRWVEAEPPRKGQAREDRD